MLKIPWNSMVDNADFIMVMHGIALKRLDDSEERPVPHCYSAGSQYVMKQELVSISQSRDDRECVPVGHFSSR